MVSSGMRMKMQSHRQWGGSHSRGNGEGRFVAAFTLLEVILAVTIAIGMMVVVLYFYQQSSTLRKDALEEMERLTSVRLVMDRLGSELRCVGNGSELLSGIKGTSTSIEFVRLVPPVKGGLLTMSSGEDGTNVSSMDVSSARKMQATVRKVIYRLGSDASSGLSSLERIEEPVRLGKGKGVSSGQTNEVSGEGEAGLNMDEGSSLTNALDTLSGADTVNTNSFLTNELDGLSYDGGGTNRSGDADVIYAGDQLWGSNTNLRDSSGYVAMEGFIDEGTNTQKKVAVSSVFAKGIGYFNLRYYDGSQWVDQWNEKELPMGVEIMMAAEDPETEESKAARESEEYSSEMESAFGESSEGDSGEGTNGFSSFGLSAQSDLDTSFGIEGSDALLSGMDTNVVVFRRIIYLPNARHSKAGSSDSAYGVDDGSSSDDDLWNIGGFEEGGGY